MAEKTKKKVDTKSKKTTKTSVKTKVAKSAVSTKTKAADSADTKPKTVTKETKPKKHSKITSLEPYREILMNRYNELRESVKSHAEELPDTGISGSAGDASDQATADYASDLFGALLERQSGTLEEVEHALEKIKEGDYGICDMCDKEIPIKRLKALPWAKFCLECQEKYDKHHQKRR